MSEGLARDPAPSRRLRPQRDARSLAEDAIAEQGLFADGILETDAGALATERGEPGGAAGHIDVTPTVPRLLMPRRGGARAAAGEQPGNTEENDGVCDARNACDAGRHGTSAKNRATGIDAGIYQDLSAALWRVTAPTRAAASTVFA